MRIRVEDVMTADVITIGPDAALKEAARLMSTAKISGIPVVEDSRLVGIITESDFVARLAEGNDGLVSSFFRKGSAPTGGRVGEVMTREPITVGPGDPVTVAARVMAKNRVKRLPVLDQDGDLVGVVSRADLMSVFARPDEAIAADIRTGGIDALTGEADTVTVSVEDGAVTLTGTVDTVTERRILEEFARQVAGVVIVENQLSARVDDTRLPPT